MGSDEAYPVREGDDESEGSVKSGYGDTPIDVRHHAASVPGTPDRGPSEPKRAVRYVENIGIVIEPAREKVNPVSLAEAIEQVERWRRSAWPERVSYSGKAIPPEGSPLDVAIRTVIAAARTQLTEPEPVYPYLAAPSGAAHEKGGG